ncbi:MAG: GreA/GreB family elongation factor [Armatimonadota bacterium]
MGQEIILTQDGYDKLHAELEQLRNVGRPEISERIRQARLLGDLSENFDYQDAKHQQGLMEARINELKATLENAHIVAGATDNGVVGIGSLVSVKDEFEDEYTIKLVDTIDPENEQDTDIDYVSADSPMGRVLIGKKQGASITVEGEGRSFDIEILSVSL